MDEALGEFCGSRNITYTRYIDDLTFSSPQPIGAKSRRTLRHIVGDTMTMDVFQYAGYLTQLGMELSETEIGELHGYNGVIAAAQPVH